MTEIKAVLPKRFRVTCQSPIHVYFADMLITGTGGVRLVVEADGAAWHSTETQKARDAEREACIRRLGYDVIRFTGSQIAKSPASCTYAVRRRLGISHKHCQEQDSRRWKNLPPEYLRKRVDR